MRKMILALTLLATPVIAQTVTTNIGSFRTPDGGFTAEVVNANGYHYAQISAYDKRVRDFVLYRMDRQEITQLIQLLEQTRSQM
jgi:hypothetical protein